MYMARRCPSFCREKLPHTKVCVPVSLNLNKEQRSYEELLFISINVQGIFMYNNVLAHIKFRLVTHLSEMLYVKLAHPMEYY